MMLGLCVAISTAHGQIISTSNTLYRITDVTDPNAQFSLIFGVTKNTDGNLYATDYRNNTIRQIKPDGTVSIFVGTALTCGYDDTNNDQGLPVSFCHPSGITADTAGNLYVTDEFYNTIRKITPTGVVSTVAGTAGTCGSADSNNDQGLPVSFCGPSGITADTTGNLYVTDQVNNTIRKITPTGVVSTVAGTVGPCGSADSNNDQGLPVSFCGPSGITADTAGNLYVADRNNHTIRKITPDGVVSTFAGTAGTCGSADSNNDQGLPASFCGPSGITADTAGKLYVADFENFTIRRITPAQVVSTVVGTAGSAGSGPYPVELPGKINIPAAVTMFSTNQLVIGTFFGEFLGANFYPEEVTIPFASFSPSLALVTSPSTKFVFGSALTLGANGPAFNPVTDAVSLQFGAVAITIPPNSFQPGSGGFSFNGVIGGVTVAATVQPKGGGKYEVGIAGSGASLAGIVNPVMVTLTLGTNVGSKAVTAAITPKKK
jgi:sugar lactone lactonase YvrE